jgi:hypothetical protein
MPRDNGHGPVCFCGCGNGERTRSGGQQSTPRRRKRHDGTERRFPADNGTVNGLPAHVQQSGQRTMAYHGLDHEGKIVTNDGTNAAYVRDEDGYVPVDYVEGSSRDPYEGYYR